MIPAREVPAPPAVVPDPDLVWDDLIGASFRSAMLILWTKVVSAIGLAWMLGVTISRQWAFGFFPYAGLSTTLEEFRRIATMSSVIVTAVAVLWVVVHLVFQRRHSLHYLWGTFLALPMVALMVGLEWNRSIELGSLVSTVWLVRIALALVATTVIFFGFLHRESEEVRASETTEERRRSRARATSIAQRSRRVTA